MSDFVKSFSELQQECYELSNKNGFWDHSPSAGEKIALMHSELSEALEALRHNNPPDDKVPEFTAAEVELADAVIRILDFAGKHNYRLAEAILAKHKFNSTRPYKHGKNF